MSSSTTSVSIPWLAEQRKPGGLATLGRQRRVSQSAGAPWRDDPARAVTDEVDDLAHQRRVVTTVPSGTGEDEVLTFGAAAVAALPGFAVTGLAVRAVVVVEQRGHVAVDDQDDVTAASTVTAVGSAEGLELLAMDGRAPVATASTRDVSRTRSTNVAMLPPHDA